MRASGYSEPATTEVCQALAVLAKYGVLGSGLSMQHTNGNAHHAAPISYLGVSPLDHSVSAGGVFGAIGQVNLDSYMNAATSPTPRASLERYDTQPQYVDPFRHAAQQATAPMQLNQNSFGLATSNAQAQAQAHAQAAIGAVAAAAAQAQAIQSMGMMSSNSPTPGDVSGKEAKKVEIPEVIVGAILGRWQIFLRSKDYILV